MLRRRLTGHAMHACLSLWTLDLIVAPAARHAAPVVQPLVEGLAGPPDGAYLPVGYQRVGRSAAAYPLAAGGAEAHSTGWMVQLTEVL